MTYQCFLDMMLKVCRVGIRIQEQPLPMLEEFGDLLGVPVLFVVIIVFPMAFFIDSSSAHRYSAWLPSSTAKHIVKRPSQQALVVPKEALYQIL